MKKPKILSVQHKETGKSLKFQWDGEGKPSEEDLDKIFQHEDDRAKLSKAPFPVADPSVWRPLTHPEESLMNPVQDPNAQTGMIQNEPNPEDEDEQNVDEHNVDESQDDDTSDDDEKDESYLNYHDSLNELSKDPEHYGHLLKAISHGKNAGVSGDEMDMDMENSGVEPERRKIAKEVIS